MKMEDRTVQPQNDKDEEADGAGEGRSSRRTTQRRRNMEQIQFHIDRKHALAAFDAYTADYDRRDPKIKLKVDHTYRVAALCERIAKESGLPDVESGLAWTIGLLHDVGRFEQLRRYGTFVDAQSIDHAQFGADILFVDGEIENYLPEDTPEKIRKVMEAAVRSHSLYRIAPGLDRQTENYCHILRDADKIDIMRVNVDVPLEEIYNTTTQALKNSTVSDAVLQSFSEEHATLRSLKKTPVDFVAGHISLVFELVYPVSVRIIWEQGYLDRLLHFESACEKTREQFAWMRQRVDAYMERRLSEKTETCKGA